MTINRKYCTQDFVFTNVMPRPFYIIYVVAFIAFIFTIPFFLIIRGLFYHGGLPLSFALMVLFMMLIIKKFTRTVVIYFDERSMFIKIGEGDFNRVLKKDVAGIYSFDYNIRDRSHVSVTIVLKNGKKINLTDANLFEKRDVEKALLLKQFLNAAIKRLNLESDGKDKWRSIQGLGAYWYASEISSQ
jgi:hypothetical protein